MEYYKYPCGCQFPILQRLADDGYRLKFDYSVENIPMTCERTWDLISDGNTKGVFQLESRLGQSLSKKLRPRNIEHLAALTAIMRPGSMESIRDNKSVTQHYIDRKNGDEPVEIYHPALEESLSQTYGEMIYQEQAMQIAQKIALFSLQEADVLRKAIGKKKPELMAKVKINFLEKCKTAGIVTDEQAEEIFGWIEKSQRYSFNKSHAVSYAINAYISAYTKAHFPRAFFTSYLYYSAEKAKPLEEICELVNNAKSMNIDVFPPDVRFLNDHFRLINKNIYFGFTDIKGVGDAVVKKLASKINEASIGLNKNIKDWTWIDFLTMLSPYINSTAIKALISAGALDYYGIPRTRMLYEYDIFMKFSPRETQWTIANLAKNFGSLKDILSQIVLLPTGKQGACANKKRLEVVKGFLESMNNPPYALEDTAEWLSQTESSLLGIPLTCTTVDDCDTSAANCTCREFLQGKEGTILLAAQIANVNEIKTKTGKTPGKKMAFITLSDISASIDAVIFPEEWSHYYGLLVSGNNVMVSGEKGRQKDSLIIKKVWQI